MAEGENLTSSQEQDHAKPTSNAFGEPCMTITISEERIYLDRESSSDRILPSLTPALPGGRSGATEEQPHIGGQRPIAPLLAQSSKVLYYILLLYIVIFRSPPSLHSLPR